MIKIKEYRKIKESNSTKRLKFKRIETANDDGRELRITGNDGQEWKSPMIDRNESPQWQSEMIVNNDSANDSQKWNSAMKF